MVFLPWRLFTSVTVPSSTLRPRLMSAIESHSRSTVSIWWLERTSVLPWRRRSTNTSRIRLTAHRVEAGERLVEDQHLGVVEDGGDELRLLLHALAELVELAVAPRREAHALQPRRQAARRFRPRHALEGGEEQQLLLQRHARVEPALLGHVPDAVAGLPGRRARRGSRSCPRPGRRMFMTMRRVVVFPGPVRAQEAEGAAAGDVQGKPLDRHVAGVGFAHAGEADGGVGHGRHSTLPANPGIIRGFGAPPHFLERGDLSDIPMVRSFRVSLQAKLLAVILLCALVPVLGIGAYLMRLNQKTLGEKVVGDPRQPPPAQGGRRSTSGWETASRKRPAGRRRSSSTRGSNRCPAPRRRRARRRDLVEYLESLLGPLPRLRVAVHRGPAGRRWSPRPATSASRTG